MYSYFPAGDSGLIVKTIEGTVESPAPRLLGLMRCIEAARLEGVLDFIPSYQELLICYDREQIAYDDLLEAVRGCAARTGKALAAPAGALIRIPVVYGGRHGPDLEEVAARCGMTGPEYASLHAAPEYRVLMMGFLPGFGYMGMLDERLSVGRRLTPRPRIPAGSVGVANRQTAVYPLASPGGWNLIGRTPCVLFDPSREKAFLLAAGDRVQFKSVSEREFELLKRDIEAGMPIAAELRHQSGLRPPA